jgi:apolipoprotein N-acyltransferase
MSRRALSLHRGRRLWFSSVRVAIYHTLALDSGLTTTGPTSPPTARRPPYERGRAWDVVFPAVIAQAGAQDVDILLSVAADWEGIDPLHGQIATFRALENGLTVVRQADDGWSVIADLYGRILSSATYQSRNGRMRRLGVISKCFRR